MGQFLIVALRDSAPIMFTALGILIIHKSGIINIGAEGMMLTGAFSGIIGTHVLGDKWLGVLFAIVVTGLCGLLFAFCTIHLKGNQVVVGVALNMLAEGVTTVASRGIFGPGSHSTIDGFRPILLGLTSMVYLGIATAFLLHVFLHKTQAGLRLRATGENPMAVDISGINVYAVQYKAVVLGAMLIGVGGCALSMAQVTSFSEAMTSGRGFIALAAVVLGRYSPIGVMLAAFVFGSGNALQFRLQALASGFPSSVIHMIPYALTIMVVTLSGRNLRAPMALGKPYSKLK